MPLAGRRPRPRPRLSSLPRTASTVVGLMMQVTFLPLYVPSEAEKADAELMAEGCRKAMAEAMGWPLSHYSAKMLNQVGGGGHARAA